MAIKRTGWSPDTCKCVTEFTWDNTVDEDLRVHTYSRDIKICPEHTGKSGLALYDALLDENQRKNITLSLSQEERPDVTHRLFTYSFDTARLLLTVSFPRLRPIMTPPEKDRIQAACDLQFGPGKVLVS